MRVTIGGLMLAIALVACLLGLAVFIGPEGLFWIAALAVGLAIPVGAYAVWIGLIVGLVHLKRREIEQSRRRRKSE